MLPLFNYLLWTFWCFYKLNNPTNWCFHTYFVTSYINTFLYLFPKALICSKLWNVLASALFQIGNTSDLVHLAWHQSPFQSVPSWGPSASLLRPGSLLTCSFPRLFPDALSDNSSLLRGHTFYPDFYTVFKAHPVLPQGRLSIYFPIQVLVLWVTIVHQTAPSGQKPSESM